MIKYINAVCFTVIYNGAMLYMVVSYNLRLENFYSHFKNYCSHSEVSSEKSESLCLIGLLDEN